MSSYLAELFGTFFLVLMGNGVVAGVSLKKSHAQNSGYLAVVLAWGLAVTLAVYAVGQYSGAHINPAVTLALAYLGSFPWEKVPGYMLAQLLGAFLGSTVVWIHYYKHWEETGDPAVKLGAFCTSPGIRSFRNNFVSEVIGTAVLILGLLFIGANEFAQGLNPLIVGALIVSIGFSLGGTTGFAINPARDFGPRLAHFILPISGKGHSDWAYAWIPVAGPLVGGFLGAALYQILFTTSF